MNDVPEKEAKAIDALVAGALLPELRCGELTDAELEQLLAEKRKTLPEDKAVLLARGNPFAASIPQPVAAFSPSPAPSQPSELAMAMNRKNATDHLSAQTRAELERKSRELLG